jgi:hypothetical protein
MRGLRKSMETLNQGVGVPDEIQYRDLLNIFQKLQHFSHRAWIVRSGKISDNTDSDCYPIYGICNAVFMAELCTA